MKAVPEKDSPSMQVIIAVIGLVIGGLVIDSIHEQRDTHDAVLVLGINSTNMQTQIVDINASLRTKPSREEVDKKIADAHIYTVTPQHGAEVSKPVIQ